MLSSPAREHATKQHSHKGSDFFFGLSSLARGTHRARNATSPENAGAYLAGAGNTYLLAARRICQSVYSLARTRAPPPPRNSSRRFILAGAGNTSARHRKSWPSRCWSRIRRRVSGTRNMANDYLPVYLAGAGNTRTGLTINAPTGKFIRWRGEHPKVTTYYVVSVVYPLARGTHAGTTSRACTLAVYPLARGTLPCSCRDTAMGASGLSRCWRVEHRSRTGEDGRANCLSRWRGTHQRISLFL
ncbi:hypothetical protein KCP76_04515 [Salmonella enterica subsp. enterica serovar Weltevreden]|nr:hypothetical protein KCP76_04515 [Salmonella enterica subsp. enterica serovar Weltevreden]